MANLRKITPLAVAAALLLPATVAGRGKRRPTRTDALVARLRAGLDGQSLAPFFALSGDGRRLAELQVEEASGTGSRTLQLVIAPLRGARGRRHTLPLPGYDGVRGQPTPRRARRRRALLQRAARALRRGRFVALAPAARCGWRLVVDRQRRQIALRKGARGAPSWRHAYAPTRGSCIWQRRHLPKAFVGASAYCDLRTSAVRVVLLRYDAAPDSCQPSTVRLFP